jgi:hypothetical protein
VPLLVALWPLLVDLERDYPFADVHDKIGRVCEKADIPFVDLLPALRGQKTAALWAHPADWHPNELAHRLAAETLGTARARARPLTRSAGVSFTPPRPSAAFKALESP